MVVDSFRSATVSLLPDLHLGSPRTIGGRSDLSFVPFLPPGLPMPGRTKEADMMLNEAEAV